MTSVVLLTRPACPLCEEVELRMRAAARWLRLEVRTVDVDDAGLADRYGDRVPIVLGPDGAEIASGRIRTGRLFWRLMRVRCRRAPD